MTEVKFQKKDNRKFFIISAVIIVLSVVIDQLTKIYFTDLLNNPPRDIQIIGKWLMFAYTENDGAGFGMLSGKHALFFVLTLLGLPLFLGIGWFTRRESTLGAYAVMLAVGGIIGNAIDRAFFKTEGFFAGSVRDFISLKNFAIFNFADMCLTVGVALFIVCVLFWGEGAIFKKKKAAVSEVAADDEGIDGENPQDA